MDAPVAVLLPNETLCAFGEQPVEHPDGKHDQERHHLVDVNGVAEDDSEDEELEDFLLALVKQVLRLDCPHLPEEARDEQVGRVCQNDGQAVEKENQVQLRRGQVDDHIEKGSLALNRLEHYAERHSD